MKKLIVAILLAGASLFPTFVIAQSAQSEVVSVQQATALAGSNAGNNQQIMFQSGTSVQPSPQAGIPGAASHSAPSLFQVIPNNFGMPVEVVGMALEVFYDKVCRPEESDAGESKIISTGGSSGLTRIVITTHPESKSLKRGDKAPTVKTDLTHSKGRYQCLGIVNVVADKDSMEKGIPVGHAVLSSDVRKAVRNEFVGIAGKVVVLSNAQYWGGAVGVTSGSSGMSLGVSLVNFLSRATTGGLAPGIAGGNGASSPASRSGYTAMILVKVPDNHPNGIEISLSSVGNPFGPPPAPIGGNGVKAEAERK